jgi:hypothetical protein
LRGSLRGETAAKTPIAQKNAEATAKAVYSDEKGTDFYI